MFISAPADIAYIPQRIISTVPSITELLYYSGLEKEVAGITKFCIHPEEWFRSKTRIGGTKQLNIEKISTLRPDLIICNKEENVQDQIESLAEHLPVYVTDIKTIGDALKMIVDIGMMTGKEFRSGLLAKKIENNFSRLADAHYKTIRTAYFIWKDPYMTIGSDTFIAEMMKKAGLENIYSDLLRYPEVNLEELKVRDPQLILLSSEPYPFREKHIASIQNIFPGTKILLADGEMFSWYGSRMLCAPAYFKELRSNT